MTTTAAPVIGLPETMPDGSPVGWYVTDPAGNVVDYGGLMFAELAGSFDTEEGS